MKRLLVVTAHPDDESIFFGGVIAKYAKAGWQVDLVCCTKGEASRAGALEGMTNELVAWHRGRELEEATKILNIQSTRVLEYSDGNLASVRAGDLEDSLRIAMDELRPDVVITFHPDGCTHHPDHVRVSRSTTFAYQNYAKDEHIRQSPPLGKGRSAQFLREKAKEDDRKYGKRDWDVTLMYYCFPESEVSFLKREGVLPSEMYGSALTGVPDKMITTVINIQSVSATKRKAIEAHGSQAETLLPYWSHILHPFMQKEYYMVRMKGTVEIFMNESDKIADRLL